MNFNEKLIELRKKEGLSQEELGYKLNVTRQTVSKWELGQTTPEMEKLSEISKIFNISVDELISNTAQNDASDNVNNVVKNVAEEPSTGIKNLKNNKLVLIIVGALLIIAVVLSVFAITNSTNNKSTVVEENITETSDGIFDKFTSLFDRFFDLFDKTLDSQESIMDSTSEFSEKFNISSFNGKFEIYNGSTLGSSLKRLLDEVITNNQTSGKLITVKYNETVTQNVDEIKNLKTNIDDFSNFEISFEYDEEGYITSATIKRVITKQEIQRFNSSYEIYAGSSMGGTIKVVLDKIITNNKTNERKISVTYTGSETLDENEIRNIKNQIDTFDNCEIIYEYDADGFIYKAIIEKY